MSRVWLVSQNPPFKNCLCIFTHTHTDSTNKNSLIFIKFRGEKTTTSEQRIRFERLPPQHTNRNRLFSHRRNQIGAKGERERTSQLCIRACKQPNKTSDPFIEHSQRPDTWCCSRCCFLRPITMLQLGNQQVNALFLLFWRDFSAGYSEEYFFNRLLNKTI